MTSTQRKNRAKERSKEESKKARRIINTIFVSLIGIMVLGLLAYYTVFGGTW